MLTAGFAVKGAVTWEYPGDGAIVESWWFAPAAARDDGRLSACTASKSKSTMQVCL